MPIRMWRGRTSEFSIADLLGKHDLEKVAVEPAREPPEQSPGGKYREIIPLVS